MSPGVECRVVSLQAQAPDAVYASGVPLPGHMQLSCQRDHDHPPGEDFAGGRLCPDPPPGWGAWCGIQANRSSIDLGNMSLIDIPIDLWYTIARWEDTTMSEPKSTPAHTRANIKRRYGCDYQTYANLLMEQGYSCAVCDEPSRKRFALVADPRVRNREVVALVCRHCRHVLEALERDRPRVSKWLGIELPIEDQLLMGGTPYATRVYKSGKPASQGGKLVKVNGNSYRIELSEEAQKCAASQAQDRNLTGKTD